MKPANRHLAAAYLRGCASGYRMAMRVQETGWAACMAFAAACGAIGAVAATAGLNWIFVRLWS